MFTPIYKPLKQKVMIPRYNDLENRTLHMLMSKARVTELYNTHSSTSMEILKKSSNANKLFVDAHSLNLTPYGNERKTEFVIHIPIYGINWRVECKSQKRDSNMIYRVNEEFDCVAKIREDKLCLILEGAFTLPHNLKKLADEIIRRKLENRVWLGSLPQFEQMLVMQMVA